MEKGQEIQSLEREILRHKSLYYGGHPEISDEEYDLLEERLKRLDPKNPVLNVIGHQVKRHNKVEHDPKMLSLGKTYSFEKLKEWIGSEEVLAVAKVDGTSLSLIYEDGQLLQAKTRGDGKFGEDVTYKILWVKTIPKKIPLLDRIEIRGELYCSKKDFKHLSENMIQLNLNAPQSPRNIVAGLLGRKDHIHLSHHLSFFAFDLIGNSIPTEREKIQVLESCGFLVPYYQFISSAENLSDHIDKILGRITLEDYLVDGLVITYNQVKRHVELGSTAHHPRYRIAFKIAGEAKDTKILDIEWSISRNGVFTPVAHVEPVELSGALISRVTLHNYGMVAENNLKPGDVISIIRSGEVIPKFLSVILSAPGQYSIPQVCPFCSTTLEVQTIRLICPNAKCPGKNKESLLNFVQKIGIDDLSSKRLEDLIEAKLISDIPSLYDLTAEEVEKLDGYQEKLAKKIVESIQDSKQVDMVTFFAALGIRGGGENKCQKIAEAGYDTFEKFINLSVPNLQNIDGFAEKSSQEFVDSLTSLRGLAERIYSKGFQFSKIEGKKSDLFENMSFVITGALSKKRSDYEKIIKDNGGSVSGSVSKNTSFLLTNDSESSSSKFKKAMELGVPIISEEKFEQLLGK